MIARSAFPLSRLAGRGGRRMRENRGEIHRLLES
jgi:hypothetical protein